MWSVRERERSWITAGGLVGAKEGWTCLSNHVGDGGLQSRIVGKLRNYILDMRRVRSIKKEYWLGSWMFDSGVWGKV